MDYFRYQDGQLACEEVPLARVVETTGTPTFVYSARTALMHLAHLEQAFAPLAPLICFSVKANGNLSVLRLLAQAGSGFDVVSGGEIFRALRAGGSPEKIVYAGVGKTDAEIEYALKQDVLMFNVESLPELEAIDAVAARLGKRARVALRVNPDVDAHTHSYVTTGKKENKFGLIVEMALAIAREALPRLKHVELRGVHAHIGSRITETGPYAGMIERVIEFAESCRVVGHPLTHLNMGGGFGIFYPGEEALPAEAFAKVVVEPVRQTGLKLIMEPGRFIIGNAGVLLTRVIYVKESGPRRFVIVDAGMNDLIRPALYEAEHYIWPIDSTVDPRSGGVGDLPLADIVGPICETSDFLALARPFPAVKRGDVLAVFGAGAYGMTMSSNYNARPRAAEVLVRGDEARVVRRRETWEDLVGPEEPARSL